MKQAQKERDPAEGTWPVPSYQFYIHSNLSQFHNPRYNISLYHIRKGIQDLVEGKNEQAILKLNKKANDWKTYI